VEQADEFTYIGTLITKDGSCGEDIRRRIGKVSALVSRLVKVWSDKNISAATKLQLYEAPADSGGISYHVWGKMFDLEREDVR